MNLVMCSLKVYTYQSQIWLADGAPIIVKIITV